jgi:hypothetical protein
MNACDRQQKPRKENLLNILRFQTNTPTEVVLDSPQGTIVEGRFGDRVLFHLTDGRVMYVPPIVARKIEAQGIAPGEPFELCKTQVKNGRLRSIEWCVRRIEAEPPDRESEEIPEEIPTVLESQLVQSIAAVNGANGNGNGHPPTTVQNEALQNGIPQTATIQPVPTTKLEHALRTAISAAHNAEKYGSDLGYVVRFDADAIKSMAITVLINMSEGPRG